ncbi:uncharacterized protein MELLADRAFT_40089 [Melampsora larici-populina 98AG31]|uniref:Uncharacterized protein n=1 Tax=Melampsora larici-populina (strain 98AG31 / pathotype 3-4-7) TaxID=747676 RepID=F4S699_MELLP|nr:uncharacterized protein MELLADRAFT_40089 [Melampsora larici-populina 98AG31]EGF99775.1 hypothetical protein MELLADRAFT_40089 [Melampsora larici-populina 98AG31]
MAANIAVIQGSSKGIGLSFARYILKNTDLKVVATSQNPKHAREAILANLKSADDRLTTVELDVRREETIEKAAGLVKDRFGRQLRLLINVSGVLLPEKSIQQINVEDMKRTFEINTFGHLLTYKHFAPLIPPKSSKNQDNQSDQDPAKGLIKPNVHVLASMSARVGSIGDNTLGGWYSYRASKSALNSIIVTLQRELSNGRSTAPAVTVALHPGTVAGTNLSKDFVSKDKAGSKEGVHDAEVAVEQLCGVISRLGEGDGGQFLDYKGKKIVW